MKTNTTRALLALVATGALAGSAFATTPESGTVSKAAPKVTWEGETTAGYATRMTTAVSGSTDTPCEAPSCETFTLTVADSANLTIGTSVGSESETAAVTVRVTKPDGEVIQENSEPGAPAGGKFHKILIKNAPVGEYTINTYDNSATTMTHSSYAELAVAAAPVVAAPVVEAPAVEPIELAVKPGKASARKRVVPAAVTVSRDVTAVQAVLKRAKKVVARAKRGASSGTFTLKLKAKRLKAGVHTLSVSATDGTSTTTKTVKVKVKR